MRARSRRRSRSLLRTQLALARAPRSGTYRRRETSPSWAKTPHPRRKFMTTIKPHRAAGVLLATLMLHATLVSAADPSAKCEATKLKTTSGYSACRLKAAAVAAVKGTAPDYTKCVEKFALKYAGAETKAGAGI